jgi:uncharacterized protein (TIGR02246 family)
MPQDLVVWAAPVSRYRQTESTLKHIVVVTAALFLSSAAFAQDQISFVQQREDQWVAALSRGDVPALAAIYEKDAWLVLPGQAPVKGRAAIAETLRGLAHGGMDMKLQATSVVRLDADFMVENGVATLRSSGIQKAETSNYEVLWHRTRMGGWKILRDVVSPR